MTFGPSTSPTCGLVCLAPVDMVCPLTDSDLCKCMLNPAQQLSSGFLWYKFSHTVDILNAIVFWHLVWLYEIIKSMQTGIKSVYNFKNRIFKKESNVQLNGVSI